MKRPVVVYVRSNLVNSMSFDRLKTKTISDYLRFTTV
jgi:hypothetical protein